MLSARTRAQAKLRAIVGVVTDLTVKDKLKSIVVDGHKYLAIEYPLRDHYEHLKIGQKYMFQCYDNKNRIITVDFLKL